MHSSRTFTGLMTGRLAGLGIAKLLLTGIAQIPLIGAAPLRILPAMLLEAEGGMPPDSASLWVYLAVAVFLVLLGGAFAGLTIALMGQDEIYLQVIKDSGDGSERKHAAKVLRLLKRGKHWVLVTLLLGNVITNETLPIVLDRSLGGGWPAVLGSTVLIVIFGEIIPQSICVRYGLPIGAWMSPLVLILMYILAPVAWPTAKLLDKLLGEDHGTTYKKAGLKTLVTLHKTLGSAGEQLNSDEVTIISAVLDLKEKPVGNIMTPMGDVFTMSADTVLDEKTMDIILSAGYSRIPIYAPDNPQNFVGMLLVKILITYDPEDCKRVREFALATLPETRKETSCLDIVNFFQEGKSHMVLVSEFPGEDRGALGVVTLEDVIEELIGEEIIDESDVFVDVHKAIRRVHPAPRSRVPKGEVVIDQDTSVDVGQEDLIDISEEQDKAAEAGTHRAATPGDGQSDAKGDGKLKAKSAVSESGAMQKANSLNRRTSSVTGSSDREAGNKRGSAQDKLKHLGPSNLASRPRQTRYNTVKIKPGGGSLGEAVVKAQESQGVQETPRSNSVSATPEGAGLLTSAGKEASDGVLAVQAGYGSIDRTPPVSPQKAETSSKGVQANGPVQEDSTEAGRSQPDDGSKRPVASRTQSHSTIGSLPSRNGDSSPSRKKLVARSGSITENIIDAGGIKKVVLELTSSSSDDTEEGANGAAEGQKENDKPNDGDEAAKSGKKKRRRKRKKGGQVSEDTPLLDREDA